MFLAAKQQQLLDEAAFIDDPQERLAFLSDRARRVPPMPSELRVETYRIAGCVSPVWLVCEHRDGKCFYQGDADSPIVRALVIFLAEFFSGATPVEIVALDTDPLGTLGITRNLSPTRRNGLSAVRARIRGFAAAHV